MIGVGWSEAERGGVAWNAWYGDVVGGSADPRGGELLRGSVGLLAVFIIVFGLGVADLADTLGGAGDRIGGSANDVVVVRD